MLQLKKNFRPVIKNKPRIEADIVMVNITKPFNGITVISNLIQHWQNPPPAIPNRKIIIWILFCYNLHFEMEKLENNSYFLTFLNKIWWAITLIEIPDDLLSHEYLVDV